MKQKESLLENDIPRMQDLIKRKTGVKDILYADLLCIYRIMPKAIRNMVKKLRKRKEKKR